MGEASVEDEQKINDFAHHVARLRQIQGFCFTQKERLEVSESLQESLFLALWHAIDNLWEESEHGESRTDSPIDPDSRIKPHWATSELHWMVPCDSTEAGQVHAVSFASVLCCDGIMVHQGQDLRSLPGAEWVDRSGEDPRPAFKFDKGFGC
eukprot:1214988-Rhodomonas_salina.1